jgi:4-amino-4-deoxy-L-arabinose transferase-like glycosyltransferase
VLTPLVTALPPLVAAPPRRLRIAPHLLLALTPIAWGCLLLVCRPIFSSSLEWDEAEQALFSQRLAWGYSHQPPLYTWLTWATTRTLGVHLTAFALVKAAVFAGLLYALSQCLRRLGSAPALAIAGSLGILLSPVFAWSMFAYTHTLLVCLCFGGTIWQMLRTLQRPTILNYMLLGAVVGLGMLAKYNYALYVGSLILAAALTPGARRVLVNWRLTLSMLVAGIILLPHALWLWTWRHVVAIGLEQSVGLDPWAADGVAPRAGLEMIARLALGIGPIVLGYWLLVARSSCVAAYEPPGCGPAASNPRGGLRMLLGLWTRRAAARRLIALRTIERTALIAALACVGAALIGMASVRMHWLAPAVMLAPLILFGRLAQYRGRPPLRRWIVAVCVMVTAAIIVRLFSVDRPGGQRERDVYFAAASQALRERGLEHSDVVAFDILTAGNLRLHLPSLRVECMLRPAARLEPLPAPAPRLVVWNASEITGDMPYRVVAGSFARAKLPAETIRARTEHISVATTSERFRVLALFEDVPPRRWKQALPPLPRSLADIHNSILLHEIYFESKKGDKDR